MHGGHGKEGHHGKGHKKPHKRETPHKKGAKHGKGHKKGHNTEAPPVDDSSN